MLFFGHNLPKPTCPTWWSNVRNKLRPTMLRYVAPKCCDRLAGACKYWLNNVVMCCVEMLPSFGRNMLSAFGHRVATCCNMLGVVGSNLKMVKFFMQHLCMLHDVVVVWPGSCNNGASGHAH